jgi:hypothetical protein
MALHSASASMKPSGRSFRAYVASVVGLVMSCGSDREGSRCSSRLSLHANQAIQTDLKSE